MKIKILAVGTLKENYFKEALSEYQKRISRFSDFSVIEIAEERENDEGEAEIFRVKEKEGERLLKQAKGYIIALDKGGTLVSSEEIASLISEKSLMGISEWNFIIGGSRGLSEEVLKKADLKISFGRVTYPHQLMRVILSEQIYRAITINKNIAYHK